MYRGPLAPEKKGMDLIDFEFEKPWLFKITGGSVDSSEPHTWYELLQTEP